MAFYETDPGFDGHLRTIRERWFSDPSLRIVRIAGYEVDLDTGIATFGTLLGASETVEGILHDMGHFVTVAEHRIARSRFGMDGNVPAFVLGRIYTDNVPLVAYLNELDAMVFERVLQHEVGLPVEPYGTIVSSLRHMPSFEVVPGESDRDRIAWLADKLKERSRGRTIQEFDALWAARVAAFPRHVAKEREDDDFFDRGRYEIVERTPMKEGEFLDLCRVSSERREAFVVISELDGDRAMHGRFGDVDRARRRIGAILAYNGWDDAKAEPVDADVLPVPA